MISRLICAIFGHKDEREGEYKTEDGTTILLYTCKRCGQGSWLIMWEGFTSIAVWDRALTADEIRMLCEIEEGKDESSQ